MAALSRCGVLLTLLVLANGGSSFADDPPSRVARVGYLEGTVSFRPANLEDWVPASRNRPLTTGDHLWTDKGSRGELHLGRTTIRLGPETAFAFLNLSDDVIQMQVTQGALSVHVRGAAEGQSMEVDTPNAAVSLLHPGTYRIDVDANGDSTVSVRRGGDAEATAEGSEVPVHAQQVGVFLGAHPPIYDIQDEGTPDDWDRWCAERDRRYDEPHVSARYVSPDVEGWEDLDAYGHWRDVPGYGAMWVPASMGASWAPYRAGHWGYVAPWGWTWIDDAPWGFAPFHYGRWAYVGGGWGWVPGTIVARPVYAPALVAFVGGGGWSASLSLGVGGGVAWFPLGPREVFYPSYAVSPTYVQNINVTHVNVTNINVTNVNATNVTYANQSVAGAVTAVPRSTFVSAQPVAAAAVAVPPSAVASVQAGGAPVGVQPTSQSVLSHPVVAASTPVAQPPAAVVSRPVVAKLTPPPAAPAPALAGPVHLAPVASASLIKPAIPPPGTTPVALRPARASLPPPRPASPPPSAAKLAPVQPGLSHANASTLTGASSVQKQATTPATASSVHTGGAASAAPGSTAQPTLTGRQGQHSAPLQGTGASSAHTGAVNPGAVNPGAANPGATSSTSRPLVNDRPSHAHAGTTPQGTGASSTATGGTTPGATGATHAHTAAPSGASTGGQGGSTHTQTTGASGQKPQASSTNTNVTGSQQGGAHPGSSGAAKKEHSSTAGGGSGTGVSTPQHQTQSNPHPQGNSGSSHPASPPNHNANPPEHHPAPQPQQHPHPQPTPTPHPKN